MMFRSKKPNLSRNDSLASRPMRNSSAKLETIEAGARLTVALEPSRWGRWLFRFPSGAKKTFELDSVGVFVWDCCDGKTSVKQIIRQLADRYNLNLREAEVSTLAFLATLTKKGLIAIKVNGICQMSS